MSKTRIVTPLNTVLFLLFSLFMSSAVQATKAPVFELPGINVDKEKALADKFLEIVPASFDIAYDPEGAVADLYSLKVMPSSYLIDRDGNLVHAHKGFKSSDGSRMEDMIRKLLKNEQ